ncbi:MAG: VWA domain-containing protein [Bradymonadaceae bacterium]|nr:VWA domain-containing protein [Lujinxingiaceae bacterium]
MHFARPENLYWLLILLPLAAAWLSHWQWKRRVKADIGHAHMVDAMAERFSPTRDTVRAALVAAAVVLLIVALAQPQWGMTEREIKRMGVDVVFALDLSSSMLAQDAAPNRLLAAATEMRTVMSRLDGDRVGLVVFTSISFPQSPLTTDYAAINFFLSKLHPDQIPVGGTSVGAATRESIELLLGRKLSDKSEDSRHMRRAKNQVIVLVTDGEDHESDPLATAALAREHGIRLVTVGIGSPDGARVPTFDKSGSLTGHLRDSSGEYVITRLDETTLKEMAAKAGGLYIHYSGKNSVANTLVGYLNELEKTELESMLRQRYKDRFVFFLAPALLLLLIAFGLGQRRRTVAPARGAPNEPARKPRTRASTTSIVLLLFLGAVGCEDAFHSTLGSIDEAVARYLEAESAVSDRDAYHYNIGRAYLSTGDYAMAQTSLARALATDDDDLKFDVLYNLGLALASQDKWQEAYDVFKQALVLGMSDNALHASARFIDARHNLELVFRKLYPPCSQLEDALEPNDTLAQARALEQAKTEKLTLCGLNDDWYVVQAVVGSHVTIKANFRSLRKVPDPEHTFLPQAPDLQLVVFDDRGLEAVAVDQGLGVVEAGELERINKRRRTERTIERFVVTPDMLTGGQNHIFAKVMAAEGLEYEYDLEIEVIPPCSVLEDSFEPNDSPAQAAMLSAGSHELHICPDNEDWFRIDAEPGDSIFVDLRAMEDPETKSAPELEVEIVEQASGKVLARGRFDGPYLTAGLQDITTAGAYLVRVRGADGTQQGPYALDLYTYGSCPTGDDRYEPNDSPNQPAVLDPQLPMHRYLRICPDNVDYFHVAPGDDKTLELGLSAVSASFSRVDQGTPRFPEIDFELLTANGTDVLAQGLHVIVEPSPNPDAPPAMPLQRVLRHEELEDEHGLVRVHGEPGFYHLVALNLPESEEQDEEEQEEEKQDEPEESDEQDKQDESDDSEQDDGEQDPGDEEKSSEQNEPDDSKADEPAEGDEAAENEDSEEDDGTPSQNELDGKEQDIDVQQIQDILQALEEADDNFQLRKALENMPARLIEKNW